MNSFKARARNAKRHRWIYALVDPRDLKPRYVGQSVAPIVRLYQHLSSTTSRGLSAWRRELREQRMRPMLLLLERVKAEWGDGAEEHWIAAGLREGWPLLNVTRLRKFREAA